MKVLFVINSLRKGGAERLIVNISNELVQHMNYEVAIYLLKDENKYQNLLNKKVKVITGVVSLELSLYKKNKINNKVYVDFLNEFKPHIIHSHLFWADLLVHSYHFKAAKYISHLHSSNIEELKKFNLRKSYKKRIWTNLYEKKWLVKRYIQFATDFIACSNGAASFHKENIKTGRIFLMQNAIPLPDKTAYKAIIKQKIKLLWVGTFSEVKNPIFALDIANTLKEYGIDFSLRMAGNGQLMNTCKRSISELLLQDNVSLLGEIENIDEEYENSHCLLHTSKYEGLPMVFIEALSHGLPVLTTACLVDNEIVVDGLNGEVIKSNNPISFMNTIRNIIISPNVYSAMHNGAIETSKIYDIKKYITKLNQKYNELNKN